MGLLLLPVVAALAWILLETKQANDLVVHTLQVETEISDLMTSVQAAESGNRGYLLTGDENYLGSYSTARAAIPGKMELLKKLTSDNAEQMVNAEALEDVINTRVGLLEQGNELRRTGGLPAAVIFIRTSGGLAAMSKVREQFQVMRNTEQRLLRERLASSDRLIRAGLIAGGLGLVIVSLAFIAWSWNSRREFRELNDLMAERERNEAQIRQMQKMEAVGQLTGGIAHDFNNMLAVILSSLNLLQKRLKAGDTNVAKFVDAALDGAARAATLTTRLMAFSRQSPLNPQPLIANSMVSGMTELIRRTLGEAIQVETVLTAGVWSINADAGQFENAILNLAVNARDAMPDGGKLTLETANCHIDDNYARQYSIAPGQYVLVAVSDTGVGMAPEVLAKAFEPFFTTKGVGRGTGLGLAQVHGFIKQSGGHIKIYSELGHGTTIKMYLPRLYNPASEESAKPAKDDVAIGDPSENAGIVILVVEDEERVREMSVASLREMGYTVIHASNAATALKTLEAHPETALLFTDIVMPEMNGRQLAFEAQKRRPELKVLYTTGFTRNAIIHNGKLDAGVHFIAKPFTYAQLAAKIREVLW
jgi:signal transduction histidine kinase